MLVKYFAYLRQSAKCEQESVTGEFSALGLLRFLAEKHGEKLAAQLLSPNGGQNDDLIMLINGRNILFLDKAETELSEEDTVALFPRVAGG